MGSRSPGPGELDYNGRSLNDIFNIPILELVAIMSGMNFSYILPGPEAKIQEQNNGSPPSDFNQGLLCNSKLDKNPPKMSTTPIL